MLPASLVWHLGDCICTPVTSPGLCLLVGGSFSETFQFCAHLCASARCLPFWVFLSYNINNLILLFFQWSKIIVTKALNPTNVLFPNYQSHFSPR